MYKDIKELYVNLPIQNIINITKFQLRTSNCSNITNFGTHYSDSKSKLLPIQWDIL